MKTIKLEIDLLKALFALITCGNMKKGDSVLIHAGTGGVGQAAIYLALHYDCTVFTTVGTPEKRDFIKRTFPQVRQYLLYLEANAAYRFYLGSLAKYPK